MQKIGMEGSAAIAEAVKLADTDVIAAYPITPQTHIVERLAELVANGELNACYVPVESEHSAMSACLGSSAVGARTFTATAGQGLELMHEVLYIASSSRLPIVMVVADRALSGPLNVWGDHSDAMATRDCGWVQIFAENAQQAFDLVLCAFRIAEDKRVLFPVMIHIDGFHLSHVIEPMVLLDKKKIDLFLPEYKNPYSLDIEKPITIGAFAPPNIYSEARKAQDMALHSSKEVIVETWNSFEQISGRRYQLIESYMAEDADTLLLTMGSYSETAMIAVDALRDSGMKVGLIRIRLWRPFPKAEFVNSVSKAKELIVLDRALSLGDHSCPVCSEVKSALYDVEKRPSVVGFVGGLGGRDISAETFVNVIKRGIAKSRDNESEGYEFVEVRE